MGFNSRYWWDVLEEILYILRNTDLVFSWKFWVGHKDLVTHRTLAMLLIMCAANVETTGMSNNSQRIHQWRKATQWADTVWIMALPLCRLLILGRQCLGTVCSLMKWEHWYPVPDSRVRWLYTSFTTGSDTLIAHNCPTLKSRNKSGKMSDRAVTCSDGRKRGLAEVKGCRSPMWEIGWRKQWYYGLETGLSSKEHACLLQRVQAWLPSLTWELMAICQSQLRRSDAPF
jgi:hypothetical protein